MRGYPCARHLKQVRASRTAGGTHSSRKSRQLPRQALTLKGILSETGFQESRTLVQQTSVQKTQVLSQRRDGAGWGGGRPGTPRGSKKDREGTRMGEDHTSHKTHKLQLPPLPAHRGQALQFSVLGLFICKMKFRPLRFQML